MSTNTYSNPYKPNSMPKKLTRKTSTYVDLELAKMEAGNLLSGDNADSELKKNLMFEEKSISIYRLYTHLCYKIDYFYIVLGILGSVVSGVAMPLLAYMMSDLFSDIGNTSESVSEIDVENIFAEYAAESIDTANDTSGAADSSGGTTQPQSTVEPAKIDENATSAELEADRSSSLNDLSALQQIKDNIENSDDVKAMKDVVDEKKTAYDDALDKVEIEDEELKEKIEGLKQQKTDKETEISDKKTQISETKDNITTKESEKSDVEAQLNSLVQPSQSDYVTVETDPETGETKEVPDTAAYQAALAEYEQQKQELEDQKTRIEEELVNLQENLATQEGELTQLEQDATDIDTQINEALQDERLKDNESVKAVQEALKAYNDAKSDLDKLKETKKGALDADINQLRENISEYSNAINKKRAEELKTSEDKEGENKDDVWKNTDFSEYPSETLEKIAENYGDGFLEKANEVLKEKFGTDEFAASDISQLPLKYQEAEQAQKKKEDNDAYTRFETNEATVDDWNKYLINGNAENIDIITDKFGGKDFLLEEAKEKFGEDSAEYKKLNQRFDNYEKAKEIEANSDKETWNSIVMNSNAADVAQIAEFYGEDALYAKVNEMFGSEAEKSLRATVEEGKQELEKGPEIPSYAVSLKDLDGLTIKGDKIYDENGKEVGKVDVSYKDVDGDNFNDKVKNYYLYGDNQVTETDVETTSAGGTSAEDAATTEEATEPTKEEKLAEVQTNLTEAVNQVFASLGIDIPDI